MKTTILSLVAFLVFGATSAFAQFNSTPAEPGLRDHLKSSSGSTVKVQVLDDKKLVIDGVSADWVSQDQITLSAVVVEIKGASKRSIERVSNEMSEYNTTGPVGTLTLQNGTVTMIHHVNPRLVSPEEITKTVAAFNAAVVAERKNLDRSMASR